MLVCIYERIVLNSRDAVFFQIIINILFAIRLNIRAESSLNTRPEFYLNAKGSGVKSYERKRRIHITKIYRTDNC